MVNRSTPTGSTATEPDGLLPLRARGKHEIEAAGGWVVACGAYNEYGCMPTEVRDYIIEVVNAAASPSATNVYLPMDCPVCGRHRVEWDGTTLKCEKCTTSSEWDGFSKERYGDAALAARPALDVERLLEDVAARIRSGAYLTYHAGPDNLVRDALDAEYDRLAPEEPE